MPNPLPTRQLGLLACGIASACLLMAAGCSSKAPPEVPSSAIQAFHRGVEAYQEEDYPRAARLFETAAAKDDRNAVIYYNLGLTYYMLEAYPESISAYQKALKLDPKFADAHMNLALAFDRTYDLDQANAHYNEYLTLVRASKPHAADNGNAAAAKPPTVSQTSKRPTLGGEPLSSLPGGTLANSKPQFQSSSFGSRPGQSLSVPASPGGRVPVGDLRRLPQESGKAPASRSEGSTSSNAAQWWTQDTPPRTR